MIYLYSTIKADYTKFPHQVQYTFTQVKVTENTEIIIFILLEHRRKFNNGKIT